MASLHDQVWQRAQSCCEYCQMPQAFDDLPFQIDHIIAKQHGGITHSDNLALSCLHCNKHKGPNIAGLDPLTGSLTPIFHPRIHRWKDHFIWNGAELIGQTTIGRTTIRVLGINHPDYLMLRKALIDEGVFPPSLV